MSSSLPGWNVTICAWRPCLGQLSLPGADLFSEDFQLSWLLLGEMGFNRRQGLPLWAGELSQF